MKKKHFHLRFFALALVNAIPQTTLAADSEQTQASDVVELPAVVVKSTKMASDKLLEAYAGGQVARGGRVGLLGNKDVMDVPFSSTTYTAQTIQDQQARTVADVILNDASVRNVNPSYGRFDLFTIRGFLVQSNDVAFGGLYGIVPPYSVPVEATERVEIMKGPNAFLNGIAPSGGVGGSVNVVPKRASDAPLNQLTGTYISDSQYGGHVDVGRRFGSDNSFGVRFNGVYQDGNSPLDNQSIRRGLGSLGLDFRGESLRLAADIGYHERRVDAPLERVAVASQLQAPDARRVDRNFAQSWSFAKSGDTYGVLRGEYDFSPNITTYAAIGARRSRNNFLRSAITIDNSNGNFTSQPNKFQFNENTISTEAGVHAQFETGLINHALNISASDLYIEYGTARQNFARIQSNIFDPIERSKPAIGEFSSVSITNKTWLSSIALSDTISFIEDEVKLTLGGRLQRVQIDAFSATTGAKTSEVDENAVTPAVGFLVKPWQRVSLYANYIEGLTQGEAAGNDAVNVGEIFPPFKSKQVETGVKVDFGKIIATASLFRITQPFTFTDPVTRIFAVNGEQRNQGAELNVFGEPLSGVRILGGGMFLDGKLIKTVGGGSDGNTAPGVPHLNVNLGGEWDTPFVPGFTLTARSIYTSSQFLNSANTQEIPEWVRFDLGARYKLQGVEMPITIRANIENLFDKRYWASSSGSPNGLVLSTPRTILLSATVDF